MEVDLRESQLLEPYEKEQGCVSEMKSNICYAKLVEKHI